MFSRPIKLGNCVQTPAKKVPKMENLCRRTNTEELEQGNWNVKTFCGPEIFFRHHGGMLKMFNICYLRFAKKALSYFYN